MIKSAEEIAHITEMARIADLGGAACVEAIEGRRARARGGAAFDRHDGARDRQDLAACRADGHLDLVPVRHQHRRRPQPGDQPPDRARRHPELNCFPMVAGYYMALERTLFAETPSTRRSRLWEINCAVHDRGKELLVPGGALLATSRRS